MRRFSWTQQSLQAPFQMESCEYTRVSTKKALETTTTGSTLVAVSFWDKLDSSGTGQMTYKKQTFLEITVCIKITAGVYCSRRSPQCINFTCSASALSFSTSRSCSFCSRDLVWRPWLPLWEQASEGWAFLNYFWCLPWFPSTHFSFRTLQTSKRSVVKSGEEDRAEPLPGASIVENDSVAAVGHRNLQRAKRLVKVTWE